VSSPIANQKSTAILVPVILPNANRFSTFFHRETQRAARGLGWIGSFDYNFLWVGLRWFKLQLVRFLCDLVARRARLLSPYCSLLSVNVQS